MGTDFLFGEKLSSNCRAEAESLVATAAVLILSSFAHHLLQSWQNVQTCLIMPGSIKKKPFNSCALNTVGPKFHLLKNIVRSKE